jgi:hypothetical protein
MQASTVPVRPSPPTQPTSTPSPAWARRSASWIAVSASASSAGRPRSGQSTSRWGQVRSPPGVEVEAERPPGASTRRDRSARRRARRCRPGSAPHPSLAPARVRLRGAPTCCSSHPASGAASRQTATTRSYASGVCIHAACGHPRGGQAGVAQQVDAWVVGRVAAGRALELRAEHLQPAARADATSATSCLPGSGSSIARRKRSSWSRTAPSRPAAAIIPPASSWTYRLARPLPSRKAITAPQWVL